MKLSASACCRFSAFFEKPFISRVNRRIDIRIVRLLRSTCAVVIWSGSGTFARPYGTRTAGFAVVTCFVVGGTPCAVGMRAGGRITDAWAFMVPLAL